MIGKVLSERYQIQKPLSNKKGRPTFLARDLVTQELVVVKILAFGNDCEWYHLDLFEREAKILQTLSHPGIPKYLNSFEIDLQNCKGFALVQTYIDANSLEAHLQVGRSFSLQEVKQIASKLLEILIYLHEHNPPIIHRDIKPSNILLTNRSGNSVGQVYLVDFGSAQDYAAVEGETFTIVGTYGYMPPEQFGGRAVPASDLYSLGATLIHLLTKLHPADLPQQDFYIQFEQVLELTLDLNCWLKKMVEHNQNRRFDSALIALQALKNTITVTGKTTKNQVSHIKNTGDFEISIMLSQRGIILCLLCIFIAFVMPSMSFVNEKKSEVRGFKQEKIFHTSPRLNSETLDHNSSTSRTELNSKFWRLTPEFFKLFFLALLLVTIIGWIVFVLLNLNSF